MKIDWVRTMEKKVIDKNVESMIQFLQGIQEKVEKDNKYIIQLKNQLEENKTEKEKKLEQEIEKLKRELAEWESSMILYGFTPKEREIVFKWHRKHFNLFTFSEDSSCLNKCSSHGHITYSIDIHPETLIKSVKCSTCGTQLVIYDDINDLWEYSENGKKRKIKKEDLEEGGQE